MVKARYEIHEGNLERIKDMVNKLCRKAMALGCEGLELTVLDRRTETNKEGKVDVWFQVELEGMAPKLEGWTFVATLQPKTQGMVVRAVPGQDVPDRYRKADARWCDHCETRRNRKVVYVVANGEGEYRQVGSTCLKDFLGHKNPHTIATYLDGLEELEEEFRTAGTMRGDGWRHFSQKHYLAWVCLVVEREGWVSRGQAWDRPDLRATADVAFGLMVRDPEHREEELLDRHYDLAEKVLEWARDIPEDVENGYLYNLRTVAREDAIVHDDIGLAASAVTAYLREQDRQNELKREVKVSEFVGEVGKRRKWVVEIHDMRFFTGHYGDVCLHLMRDAEGNHLVWFSSNRELEIGKTYEMTGTVKEHRTYNGKKQTVLTRCRVKGE